ncbi:TetR/AcrR family transcriptional regulator [Methylocucumis oryzae]|uniref:TetR family transcriptional regulator n=1 Tax=Methylocucumis oryzae TaxID=1632867 RepID=A0A0F3IKC1_9GAMM|nr:TetR/AcrR family transcriptional regulator [Methylocucumis oryzae]KJV07175.1 TetR family transcriptional regulator [Methylocucumis oryzae]
MARRSEHSQEQIREMVLSAAEKIVVERGFDGLTMRRIAGRIGYTVGSIYMVFQNMADLVLHINALTLDQMAEQLKHAVLTDEETYLELYAKTYLHYAHNNLNRWRLIFEFRLPDEAEVPTWYQAKVDAIFKHVEEQFTALSEHASEDEKRQAARTLWAGVHGVCSLSLNGTLGTVGINDVDTSVVLLTRSFLLGWTQKHKS